MNMHTSDIRPEAGKTNSWQVYAPLIERKKKSWAVRIIVALLCLFPASGTYAQTAFSWEISTGITTPILDNGIGFHLGVNPTYNLNEYFALEGQASYLFTRIEDSFLTGEKATVNALNLLAGPRLYILGPDRKVRPFINLLVGGNYQSEQRPSATSSSEFTLGFSGGGYVLINQLVLGLSYDTPQNIVLKVGYRF
jgi:hypothetical protein